MGRDREWLEQLKEAVRCETVLEHWTPAWRLDRCESSRQCRKYRREAGEILLVNHEGRGWWDPCSEARGGVLGLVRHLRPEMGFTEVCSMLRAFAGMPVAPPSRNWLRSARPSAFPAAAWESHCPIANGSNAWRYLHATRAIPASVLVIAIRANALREGPHGTAWFAHRDQQGVITGIEMRGPAYRGFSSGGTKTLFRLNGATGLLPRLAVTEAAIDALSLAALEHVRPDTLYLSTAGGIGPGTEIALHAMLSARVGVPGAVLVVGTDADATGDRHAQRLSNMAASHGIPFARLRPGGSKDWNERLSQKMISDQNRFEAGH